MSRPAEFEDLPPEEQERIGKLFDAADAGMAARVRRSIGGRTRLDTGADFEGELDQAHTQFEFRKWGRIRRNHIPTKVITDRKNGGGPRRIVVSGADVDRSGWVSVECFEEATIFNKAGWHGVPYSARGQYHQIIPVSFDAKVLPEAAATYQHAKDLQHQLHSLRDAANAGEYAFLLILCRRLELVFAIPIQKHFDALVSGRGVKVYERLDGGRIGTLLPHVRRDPLIVGWNWIPLLQHCAPK